MLKEFNNQSVRNKLMYKWFIQAAYLLIILLLHVFELCRQFFVITDYSRCAPPQVVAFAESVEQVSGVARLCNEHRVPLIPFGSGTGLEGGINAIKVLYR